MTEKPGDTEKTGTNELRDSKNWRTNHKKKKTKTLK
jgi:hypothetical protein